MVPFKGVLLFFICFISGTTFWSLGGAYLRVSRSRIAWLRTQGKVKSFGVNDGTPSIAYQYTVDGHSLDGSKFTPGPLVSYPKGSGVSFPKSFYLTPEGMLKFLPGSEVEIFYDPSNPVDSCLVRKMPFYKGLLIVLPVLACLILAFVNFDWLVKHLERLFPLAFLIIGMSAALYGSTWLRRSLKSKCFPCVLGELNHAEVCYSPGNGNGGGYYAKVEFEYRVNGILYQSQQLRNLPLSILKSRSCDAEAVIAHLQSEPNLQIFYDPKAPWDGFLQQTSMLGALSPLLLSLPFLGAGILFGMRAFPNLH